MGRKSLILEQNREAINDLAKAHKATFGSAARGDDTDASDIDSLAEFESGSSLFDLPHLQDALSELPRCDVDVISTGGLTDRDDHIRREAIPL